MYRLKVISQFNAAHNLRGYKGKCESLHGHNWKVEVFVVSDKLDSLGMVIDFKDLKKEVNRILDDLDHKYLNEMEYFKQFNPSSENIARYIYTCLEGALNKDICKLEEIRVWETDTSCASYLG
ncbi:MAG: 6-carboxytetrahydropterin synthase QueD [Candidatus Omnitrophota bacterium]